MTPSPFQWVFLHTPRAPFGTLGAPLVKTWCSDLLTVATLSWREGGLGSMRPYHAVSVPKSVDLEENFRAVDMHRALDVSVVATESSHRGPRRTRKVWDIARWNPARSLLLSRLCPHIVSHNVTHCRAQCGTTDCRNVLAHTVSTLPHILPPEAYDYRDASEHPQSVHSAESHPRARDPALSPHTVR